jgi:glycosyltransferase involved in cell wall biosynthesis
VPELLLAGRPTRAAQPWLERLARPPLRGHARHLGYVSDAERLALYQRARLLVLPSYNEGFGLPILEAMAVGVPVVASNRGAIPEVLGDAGIMVEPDAAEALAEAMQRTLSDPVAAAAAAGRGVRRARMFDWDEAAAALRVGYTEAIATQRSRRAVPVASR